MVFGLGVVLACFASLPVFEIVPLEAVSETSSNASIGDLNSDGNPDIVLIKGRHWQLPTRIFLGDGKGNFKPGADLPSSATRSYSGSLADMTRSGHLDIVLSNDAPDPKLILVNDGAAHFKVGATYGDPKWSTRNAAVGDLDGNGFPDIAVANRGMTSYVCFNNGKLHFQCNPLLDTPSAASILIADVNRDGKNDIVFPCRDNCQSRVFFGGELGKQGIPWGPVSASIRAVAVADLNGDGYPDIAACPEKLGCFVYFNDHTGNFGSGVQFQRPQALPYSMMTADLNGDGHPDIAVGYVDAPGVIYFNEGTGRKFEARGFGDGRGAIYGMAAGELTGSGRLDLVAARSDAPSFILFNRSK